MKADFIVLMSRPLRDIRLEEMYSLVEKFLKLNIK